MEIEMLELSKEQIRRLAIDDTTYNRGVRYYKTRAVSNVTWSKGLRRYQAVVHGNNDYRVTVRLSDYDNFHYNCNCPSKTKYQGACKHVVAVLLFLADYLKMLQERPEDEEDMAAFRIIHYFEKHEETPVYGEQFDIALTVSVPDKEEPNSSTGFAAASLRFGTSRLYKIQNIKHFLEMLTGNREIQIAKNVCYIPEESSFTTYAKKILDFMSEIYEIQESNGKTYFSKVFSKAKIILTEEMFARLMKLTKENSFTLELEQKDGSIQRFEHVQFKEENPEVSLELLESEDELYLFYQEQSVLSALSGTKKYFFDGEILYAPERLFLKTFLPFYVELKKQDMIVFRGKQKEHFISSVFLPLYEQTKLSLPETLQDRYVKEDLLPKCYLEREGQDISLRLEFHYGSHILNPLRAYEAGFIVIRQMEREQEILNVLDRLLFFPYQDRFLLREEEAIYYFLTEGCAQLSELTELYYTDDVRRMQYSGVTSYHTVIGINPENNLLELQFLSDAFEPGDLKSLFYAIKIKKKFHRLKNGNFMKLDDPELKKWKHLIDALDISWQEMTDNTIRVEKYKALYVKEALESLGNTASVQCSEEFEKYLRSLLGKEKTELPTVPPGILAALRTYQKEGFAWLKRLAEHSLGGILADDMGLGKTLQAITYIMDRLQEDREKGRKFLVICPTSLVYNWREEFEKFAPKLVTKVVHGNPQERRELLDSICNGEIVITSYALVRRDVEQYQQHDFDTIFIDEAQYIKNPSSLSARMVKQIKARHRFALTGTPIENSLGELWSIFSFIMPNYLPRYSRFQELYERPIVNEQNEEALKELERYIQPFLLRRMKKEVLDELPDKIELKYMADMTEGQAKLYQSYLYVMREQIYGDKKQEYEEYTAEHVEKYAEENLADFLSSGEEERPEQKLPNRFMVLSALTRLRQICCHPAAFLDGYKDGSGKYNLLMEELLPDLLEAGHRILIFSQFTAMLELIAEGLDKKEISYYRLEGSTPVAERQRQVKDFNHEGSPIFLISLKAGGTGLNLIGADTVIHFDPWWNPAVEEQAEDRAYRIGQDKNVQVIRLITKDTIEEKIYEMQKRKQALSDTVISVQDMKILFEDTVFMEKEAERV